MNIISIEGESEINITVNSAMYATLVALVKEGKLTEKDKEEFLDTHIATLAEKNGSFKNWFKRVFGNNDMNSCVVVCKTLI